MNPLTQIANDIRRLGQAYVVFNLIVILSCIKLVPMVKLKMIVVFLAVIEQEAGALYRNSALIEHLFIQ
ncbi:hypothetical protein D3C84_1172980 [compost metagenome]